MIPFLFGNLLNGTVFAERERDVSFLTIGTLRATFWRAHTLTGRYIFLSYFIIIKVLLSGNAVFFLTFNQSVAYGINKVM